MKIIYTLSNINDAAKSLLAQTGNIDCIAFHGGMGAGKTTFITAFCKALGVVGTIGSPTYSIINQYKTTGGKNICHMDWYRLKDEEEAINAGVEDALYNGDLCLIEWPEIAASLLPHHTLHLQIEPIGETERKITKLIFTP